MSEPHECIHEELVQDHSLQLKEIQTEVKFKKEKIDKLQKSVELVDEKLDKLILQSERSDFDIDTRVTQLETSQKTMKWVVGFGLTAVGTATTVLAFIITIIH